jgi:hypothetical protein
VLPGSSRWHPGGEPAPAAAGGSRGLHQAIKDSRNSGHAVLAPLRRVSGCAGTRPSVSGEPNPRMLRVLRPSHEKRARSRRSDLVLDCGSLPGDFPTATASRASSLVRSMVTFSATEGDVIGEAHDPQSAITILLAQSAGQSRPGRGRHRRPCLAGDRSNSCFEYTVCAAVAPGIRAVRTTAWHPAASAQIADLRAYLLVNVSRLAKHHDRDKSRIAYSIK